MGESRRYNLKLYPNASQRARLDEVLELHRVLYNAALQERRDSYAYRKRYGSDERVSRFSQQAQLKHIRAVDSDYASLSSQALSRTIYTLELAFEAFFRRVKAGQAPGYPRFQRRGAFRSWAYIRHGNGWKLTKKEGKNWTVYLTETGPIRARGKVPAGAEPCDLRVVKEDGGWVASIVFDVEAGGKKGKRAAGLDWGVRTFATVVFDDGAILEIPNPRIGKGSQQKATRLNRSISRKFVARSVDTKRGRRAVRPMSNREREERERLAAFKAKEKRRRDDFQHQTSHHLLRRVDRLATEKLDIRDMTRKGPGWKRAINREILDTAPAAFVEKLRYKSADRGVTFIELPASEVRPSQTCPACGRVEEKALSQRVHRCPCGHEEGRDVAAARVMLKYLSPRT